MAVRKIQADQAAPKGRAAKPKTPTGAAPAPVLKFVAPTSFVKGRRGRAPSRAEVSEVAKVVRAQKELLRLAELRLARFNRSSHHRLFRATVAALRRPLLASVADTALHHHQGLNCALDNLARVVPQRHASGQYRPFHVHALAPIRRRRSHLLKLRTDPVLRAYVIERLRKRWSPQQISRALR